MSEIADFPQLAELSEVRCGENYAHVRLGPPETWGRYAVRHPLTNDTIPGKVFLKAPLGLTGTEISFGVVPAGGTIPFLHKHKTNEEVYLVVGGSGQAQIDGQVFDVAQGDAVRIDPEGVRSFRASATEDLHYVVIQAKAGSLTHWTGTDGVGVPGTPVWPEG